MSLRDPKVQQRDRAGFWPHVCDVYRAVPTPTGVVAGDPTPTRLAQGVVCQITRIAMVETEDEQATVTESHTRVTFPGAQDIRNGDWTVERSRGPNDALRAIAIRTDPVYVSAERRFGDTGQTTVLGVEVEKPGGIP